MTDTPHAIIDAALQAHLQTWQGNSESHTDWLTASPVAALAATLDRADPAPSTGTPLPALWHWLYFLPFAPHSQIGEDGHPRRGGFLPPVPLPRRMWAGSRLRWNASNPLQVGQEVQRTSTIQSVKHKAGRSGELLFVLLEHRYANAQGEALVEEQDIVYRAAAAPGTPAPAPQKPPLAGQAAWSRSITPDPVLLFRYSALTFNGHRIHYDRDYATREEGYSGLVVHGPLLATLLMDLLRRHLPEAKVASFAFKAVRPTLDTHTFSVHGKPSEDGKTIALWGEDHEGWLTIQATVELA
ncbi:MAG: MaoC family dehydratase N-terminal domain-containing protein [Comamonadaceae bacterium]|nr:MaoC family dehydratase N-terminal domain-containing protein [Comamonadaceae bacterium]